MALRLRPVRRADLDILERWWSDPQAQGHHNWFGFAPDGQLRRRFEHDGLLSYFAVHHGPNPGSRAFNVGIALLPEHRGRGHGAEAQRQLAVYLFVHTTTERLEASTDVDNLAEQRALERAGFTREGVLRHAQFRGGGFHDLVLYSRLRGD
ncbi:MAG TPA: GNAT family protein [Actinomycetota bacterium]|nr:GNAT family protein [Actinomycetota bacterium]